MATCFKKVDKEQFVKDYVDTFGDICSEEGLVKLYEKIELPKRKTKYSAGYDFVTPFDFTLNPGETIKIPTGIRVRLARNQVLLMYIRSSIGFKYETVLTNGTGVIDSDYFFADNQGHIFAKIRNDGKKTLSLKSGDAFCQGVITKFELTNDDAKTVKADRKGGIGSTNESRN